MLLNTCIVYSTFMDFYRPRNTSDKTVISVGIRIGKSDDIDTKTTDVQRYSTMDRHCGILGVYN
jgi:hypothetical protein